MSRQPTRSVYALQLNKPDVAEYLMTKATPDVRAATKVGDTALHWACYFGHTSIAGVLLALGADCNAVGDSGNRPLHLAASRGHVDIVAMLLIQGADTRFKNAFGISAATITANKKCQKLIQRVHEGGDGERSAIKAELEVEQAELRAKLEAELQLSNASKTEALEREQAAKARRQAEDDEEDRLDEVARLKREAEEAERRRQEELKRIEEEKERRRLEELKRKEKRAKRAAKKKGGDKGAKKK